MIFNTIFIMWNQSSEWWWGSVVWRRDGQARACPPLSPILWAHNFKFWNCVWYVVVVVGGGGGGLKSKGLATPIVRI